VLQLKEQIRKEKEQTMLAVDDKVVEVKDRLRQINDMIEKNEESKRVLGTVKIMFKD